MEIKQITEQNPWWENPSKINEDEKIKQVLRRKNKILPSFKEGNLLLIGPRQVGKTTHLKLIIKNLIETGTDPKRLIYFSCELLKDYQEIIEIVRFTDSLTLGRKFFFFDEVTFVPEWQKAIKYLLDSPLGKEKNFWITGSSSIALKKETFPGREIKTEKFLPWSFRKFVTVFGSPKLKTLLKKTKVENLEVKKLESEIKKLVFFHQELSFLFEQFLSSGGFPRSAYELMEENKIKEETKEIYWKWLVSDIAKIERSERITHAILQAILKNYGTKFSLNAVAKEMEIGSHVTVRDYLEILEDLFVIRNIFAIDLSKKRELFRKMRKVYLLDPFLYTSFKKNLIGKRVEEDEKPHLAEGIVGEHLGRKFERLSYFSGQKEIDFVLPKTGIELKYQNKASSKDFPKLPFENKILLSKNEFNFLAEEKLLIAPVCLFLALI